MKQKKYLGQHFLTAPSYAKKIAYSVPVINNENVLEIGPGAGALSIFLKERFPEFHLVEIDPEAVEAVKKKLGDGSWHVHHEDALSFDFETAGFPLHVVGNLPYSVGAMIIKKTLLYGNNIKSCTFMVQREVALRIVSQPHKKTNSFLTIFCGFFGTPRLLFNVPPGAFFPPPSVDSSVFQIIIDENLDSKLDVQLWNEYFAFVSKGFSKRRKQIANVLGTTREEKDRIGKILVDMGLDPLSRPEDLGPNEWLNLFKTM
ncbi:MAG: 16S rRNA (adenine(1518)-N(6)/adenine(1519)-N(6))-dimethyltransferase RsmA [Fibrobacter sp.]|nr:16S rRNA (adenine(1518)-N(6)/adenine(1519)-N(6))-dimethyltransferase RsmA [Fibrobacter sp.]